MASAVSFEFTDKDREAYAAALLREPDGSVKPMRAAIAVFGGSRERTGVCAFVAATWPDDPKIVEIQQRLVKDDGISNFLPTKEQVMRRAWEWTASLEFSNDEKLKALRLLADVSGWIAKPGTNVNVDARKVVTNNVMVVQDFGQTIEEWELAAMRQQELLTTDHNASGGSRT